MLEVERKKRKIETVDPKETKKNRDVIVTKTEEVTTYDDKNRKITEIRKTKVNLTKQINETKKLVLSNNTKELIEKLDEMKGALTK